MSSDSLKQAVQKSIYKVDKIYKTDFKRSARYGDNRVYSAYVEQLEYKIDLILQFSGDLIYLFVVLYVLPG